MKRQKTRKHPKPSKPKGTITEITLSNKLNTATSLHRQGQLDQAKKNYKEILQLHPKNFDALHLLATVYAQQHKLTKAISFFDLALKINPNHASSLNNRGNALRELKHLKQALDSYNQAIAIKPNYAEALNNRGAVLYDLKYFKQALNSYEQALNIKPDYAESFNNRGNALLQLNQHELALTSYDQAIAIQPNYAEAHYNRGNTLLTLNHPKQALESYTQALAINPNYAEAFNNLGTALINLKHYEQALNCYKQALVINQNYVEAFYNQGNTLVELGQHEQALHSYERTYTLQPDYEFLLGRKLHTKMSICDWLDIEIQFEQLAEKITQNKKASAPFPVLAISSDLALQKKAAEIFMQTQLPANLYTPDPAKFTKHNKIHIGYFSADFHNHATAYLMAELFELHDKLQFELTAFSFGPDKHDEMRQRLTPAFHSFLDVRNKSDKEIALLARSLEIDIAIDLKGFTKDSRPGIFAFRAAPIQVNYLGYPGTMATEYIDYLIADPTLIPESHQKHYTEKIIYLPNSYQANDAKRYIADTTFTRSELGLPPTGFVFCCFNNNYKITPNTFSSWMRILKQTDGSVLWLLKDHQQTVSNLREEAKSRGINPERLIFADRMPLPEHLARHRLADLFLDTLPCNAHTTASDALWAGLPVLTCLGETFAGRVAASLLTAIHLPELLTSSTEAYETLAINLANNPDKLDKLDNIKTKLNNNRLTTPLFNASLFTQHLEAAYTQMYHQYQHNLILEHIYITNIN